ncbi:Hypothetical protein KLENKIAIHU_3956, partial [Klenkia terrae]
VPIVPDQKKVSSACAPKNSALTSTISAMTTVEARAARAGTPSRLTAARPRSDRPSGAVSRAKANTSREAPTTQARQQPKALIAAPRVMMSPIQEPMYAVPMSPSSEGEAVNAATPASSVPKAIISTAVTTTK